MYLSTVTLTLKLMIQTRLRTTKGIEMLEVGPVMAAVGPVTEKAARIPAMREKMARWQKYGL